jgi:hypothetical protein
MKLRFSLLASTFLALTLAITGATSAARASIVEALDLDALVAEAEDVVLARVIKQWSHYDERGRIVTDYSMQVEETQKGKSVAGAALTVRRLGGVVGDRGMRIAGEPTFRVGELVLLFGRRDGETYLRPVGMAQGAMRVFEQNGERWTRSDTQGMALVRHGASGEKARAAAQEPRRLSDLMQQVRELVAQQR